MALLGWTMPPSCLSPPPSLLSSSSSPPLPFAPCCCSSFLGSTQHLLSNHHSSLAPPPFQRLRPHTTTLPSPKPPPLITARIKWRKDLSFDNVIQRQKKLKLATKIKDLLIRQPGMVMSLRDLGKYRRHLGLRGKRRCAAVLRKYPAVFEVFEEGVSSFFFRLTPEAEEQFLEELGIRKEMEGAVVEKVRKLLMMSIDKTILIVKIGHIRRDLGLPPDFRESVLPHYPQFFKIIETAGGPALELTSWDPKLAVTAYEKKKKEQDRFKEASDEATTISGRVPKFRKVDLPKGFSVSRKDKERIINFLDMPFVSPYEDFTQLDPSSPEAEKHAVAVVHELLNLTLEKRTLVDHLTHFRRDFTFSQRVRSMLIRHPEFFYVSLKGDRDSVFLRDAYNASQLIEKDPLVLAKEKLGELVAAGRKHGRSIPSSDDEHEDEDEDEDDGDLEDEDDWSDSEDENTSFYDHRDNKGELDDRQMKEFPNPLTLEQSALRGLRHVDRLHNNRVPEPVHGNPRPRERW